MKYLLVICFFIYVGIAKSQKRYSFRLTTRYVLDYYNNQCECLGDSLPKRSNGCSGIDSVQVQVYKGTNLLKAFYSDSTGDFPKFGLQEDSYTLVFSKMGYVTDTATVDLIHLYNFKKTSHGISAGCSVETSVTGMCSIIMDNTFSFYAPMKKGTFLLPKKKGVKIVPKE